MLSLCLQHVWSESEDCLPFLQLAQDYISSCGKKTLLEVLEKVFTSFRPVRNQTLLNDDCCPMCQIRHILLSLLVINQTKPVPEFNIHVTD